MGLTPLDAEKLEFQSGFRGYDRNQVEQFRALVVQTLELHIRDAAELKRRIEELERSIAGFRENEELLRSSMMLAQKTGEDVVAGARREAELIKAEAHADCQEIRNELTRLRAEREEFEYSFHGLLTGFLRRLEQGNTELRGTQADSAAPLVEPRPSGQPALEPPAIPESLMQAPPVAEHNRQQVTRFPFEPTAPPVPADPPVRYIQASHDSGLDRDADIDQFSQALNQAPVHELPKQSHARLMAQIPLQPAAADLDEDMDMAAELENFSVQTDYPEEMPRPEELPYTQPMAGLEEIESLPPPGPEAEDPWEPPSEPHDEQWSRSSATPASTWEPTSPARVQPSRSSIDQPELGGADGGALGIPPQIAASNLNDIFGGQSSQQEPAEEDDDIDQSSPTTW